MKNFNWQLAEGSLLVASFCIVFFALIILWCAGCTQVIVHKQDIYDDTIPIVLEQKLVGDMVFVKVNTLFKDIDFGDIWYKEFGIEKYKGTSNPVDLLTPWGWLKTKNP